MIPSGAIAQGRVCIAATTEGSSPPMWGRSLPLMTLATAFFGLSLATACGTAKVSMAEGTREYTASDYPVVLNRWTRSEHMLVLSELDDLLTVTSTFETWDFRWAYVVRYAHDYRLTVDQRRALLEKALSETSETHRFYVALYGSNRRATDLTRKESAWIVRLIDDQGNETAPTSIESIPKPGALEKTYFPYTTVFRSAFRVMFPAKRADGQETIPKDVKWVGLRFAGAEGSQELHWDLAKK